MCLPERRLVELFGWWKRKWRQIWFNLKIFSMFLILFPVLQNNQILKLVSWLNYPKTERFYLYIITVFSIDLLDLIIGIHIYNRIFPYYRRNRIELIVYFFEILSLGGPFNTRGEGMVFILNQIIFFLPTRKHNLFYLPDQKQTIFFLRCHRQTFFSRTCLKIHSTAKQACMGRSSVVMLGLQ